MMIKIPITAEMVAAAKQEAAKRNPDIKHHFEVPHFSAEQRDILGFIGEFASCLMFSIDWRANIRPDYKTIDSKDFEVNGKKIDVKTESVPSDFVEPIVARKIDDNKAYGRRLIVEGQGNLIQKYDAIIFGLVDRDRRDYWMPIGWISSADILSRYKPTDQRPYGGKYPFAGFPVKTSELKDVISLGAKDPTPVRKEAH